MSKQKRKQSKSIIVKILFWLFLGWWFYPLKKILSASQEKISCHDDSNIQKPKHDDMDSSIIPQSMQITSRYRSVVLKYERCNELVQDYIIFDLETTGLDASSCEIMEIGAIKFENGIEVSRFQEYVKINGKVPENITELTGITNDMLSEGKDIKIVLKNFKNYIGQFVLVAHNAPFDMKFLQSFYHAELGCCLENQVIDTLILSAKHMKRIENHKLETIKNYFHIDLDSHNALDDCYVTSVLYQYLVKKIRQDENRQKKVAKQTNAESTETIFSDFENSLLKTVKSIVSKHNLDCDFLTIHKNQKYTDIWYKNYNMLRFKTEGRLQYWLLNIDFKEFSRYSEDLKYTEGSKSENGHIRLFIQEVNTLFCFEDYIINEYRRCRKSSEDYEEWVNKGKPMNIEIRASVNIDENGKSTVKVDKYEY